MIYDILRKLYYYFDILITFIRLIIETIKSIRRGKYYYERYLLTLCDRCSDIIIKLTTINGSIIPPNTTAIFVPELLYGKYKQSIIEKLFVVNEYVWDYDLQIGETIEPMILIWIKKLRQDTRVQIPYDLKFKRAFTFLEPKFLRYIDKPFRNQDAITQVNLILDYYRTEKRQRGIEIFNIFDLINFKMAIDDNRYVYENCEFHKLIERILAEAMKSGKYNTLNNLFNFDQYLNDIKYYCRPSWESVDYLVYNFQNTIGSILYSDSYFNCTKLSHISNIPYNKKITVKVTDNDASGSCSDVLYELITKDIGKIFDFDVNGEWFYSGKSIVKEMIKPLSCKFAITTANSFNFIENFINWLKLTFGKHSKCFDLRLTTDGTINAHIFNNFYVNLITFKLVELNCKLLRMLKLCKYRQIIFDLCKIPNDRNGRFDLIGRQSETTKNIFKHLEELDNVMSITFELNEHMIGMLFAYVASVMAENESIYKLRNKIKYTCNGNLQCKKYIYEFRRSNVNSVVEQIEAYTELGQRIDFYRDFHELKESDREEFNFYQ